MNRYLKNLGRGLVGTIVGVLAAVLMYFLSFIMVFVFKYIMTGFCLLLALAFLVAPLLGFRVSFRNNTLSINGDRL